MCETQRVVNPWNVLPEEVVEAGTIAAFTKHLDKYMNRKGMEEYGSCWTGPPPLTGCEVFIGKLPQDLYEDKLIPLFQMAGKLYEFRLMMTFSGENRGFAYAKYANRWYAQCAIAMFNGYQICDGLPMVVCKSTEKNELCVRGIPWGKQRLEVLEVLKELTEGVTDLSLHLNKERRKKMALFAVVTYQNHRAAAMAKKTLVE
eukprot:g31039.t1